MMSEATSFIASCVRLMAPGIRSTRFLQFRDWRPGFRISVADAKPGVEAGDDVAGMPPLTQRAVKHIPRTTGFVARAELAVAGHAVDPLLQLGQVVRQPLESGRRLPPLAEPRS